MNKIDTLEAKLKEAKAARRHLAMIVADEARAAKERVVESYREKTRASQAKVWEAEKALNAEKDKNTHPLEGKRVYRLESTGYRHNGQQRIEGIVEVCRSQTRFADNLPDWRRPNRGEAFVRLLTSSGKVGKRICASYTSPDATDYNDERVWKEIE